MVPGTALAFVLVSIALFLAIPPDGALQQPNGLHQTVDRLWSQVFAGVAFLMGTLRLCDYLADWNLNIDHLWIFGSAQAPGRMSPATAFGFVAIGGAVILACRRRFTRAFEILTLITGLTAWLGLSRYLYGGTPLLPFVQMAVHTAAAFLILSVGTLCLRADGGLIELLVGDSVGGQVARYLLVPVLVAPLALAWIQLQSEHAGWFGPEASMSLSAFLDVLILGGLVWGVSSLLHRTDNSRQTAVRKLRKQYERLGLLNEITTAIAQHLDPLSIFQVVAHRVEDDLPADLCGLCLTNGGGTASSTACVGTKGHQFSAALCVDNDPKQHLDLACIHPEAPKRLVFIPEMTQVASAPARQLAQAGILSLVMVPLKVDDESVGMLVVGRRAAHAFDSGECEFLRQLSEHVAWRSIRPNCEIHCKRLMMTLSRPSR